MTRGWLLAHVPFLVLLALVTPVIWPQDGVGESFFFWYAGHLVATGATPYDQNAWALAGATYGTLANNVASTCTPSPYAPSCLWVYPPTTAILFAPFSLLSVSDGVHAVTLFILVTTATSVVLVGQWIGAQRATTRALALCAAVVSHPFAFDVNAGHFEGLGVIGIVLVATGLTKRQVGPVVGGALLMSLKPHLYVGLGAVVLLLLLSRRDWRTIGWTVGVVAAVNGLALLRLPGALDAMLSRGGQVAGVGWATTWAFASDILPSALVGIVIVYLVVAVAFIVAVRLAPANRRIAVLVAGGAAISLAVSPYAHPYDMLLLVPAFAIALALDDLALQPGRGILQLATSGTLAIGTWLAIFGTRFVPPLPGALPVVVLVLLAIAAWTAHAHSAADALRGTATSAPGSAGSSRP